MNYLLKEVSKELNQKSHKINQNFGDRHYKTLVASSHYALNVYKYVYQNPLRSELAQYCEEWPWSTLHGILGFKKLIIPIEPDQILFNPHFDDTALRWLNQKAKSDHIDEMKRYLKKGIMRPTTNRKTTRISELEHQRI